MYIQSGNILHLTDSQSHPSYQRCIWTKTYFWSNSWSSPPILIPWTGMIFCPLSIREQLIENTKWPSFSRKGYGNYTVQHIYTNYQPVKTIYALHTKQAETFTEAKAMENSSVDITTSKQKDWAMNDLVKISHSILLLESRLDRASLFGVTV